MGTVHTIELLLSAEIATIRWRKSHPAANRICVDSCGVVSCQLRANCALTNITYGAVTTAWNTNRVIKQRPVSRTTLNGTLFRLRRNAHWRKLRSAARRPLKPRPSVRRNSMAVTDRTRRATAIGKKAASLRISDRQRRQNTTAEIARSAYTSISCNLAANHGNRYIGICPDPHEIYPLSGRRVFMPLRRRIRLVQVRVL